MNWEAFFRWTLAVVLLGICGAMMIMGDAVPNWFQVITAGIVGNSMRLQYTKTETPQ